MSNKEYWERLGFDRLTMFIITILIPILFIGSFAALWFVTHKDCVVPTERRLAQCKTKFDCTVTPKDIAEITYEKIDCYAKGGYADVGK